MSTAIKPGILVVDDEPHVLTTYGMILTKKGYDVETAISSVEAIRAIDRRDFDLLLCDYSLEQEHTGFEVIEYARRKRPGARAALITGYASLETANQAKQNGVAVLYKPIDIEEFFQTIETLLREDYEPHESSQEEGQEPSPDEKRGAKRGAQHRTGRGSRTARRAV